MLAAIEGDREAYEKFLNRVAGLLSAFLARSMNPALRSDEKIEELTQETLISIHTKRSTYRPEMPILPWIFAIGRYRLIDSVRKDSRRLETVAWDQSFESIAAEVVSDEDPGTLSGVEIDALLSGLSDRQRKVLKLAKLNDMPLADVAQHMKMSLSAVKVTVHRALRTLQRKHGEPESASASDGEGGQRGAS
jgi:RNA polymerase sigma-70 factor (ECF subfamily)